MTTLARTWTAEQFWEFVNRPENADRMFELHNGEIVEIEASGMSNSELAAQIAHLLALWNRAPRVGRILGADGAVKFTEWTVLVPDATFIPKARLPETTPYFCPAVPALVVEVVSPNQTLREMRHKMQRYLGFGVDVVWLVYPDERIVEVYTTAPDNAILSRDFGVEQTLDGGEIMPGLSIAVADIFAVLDTLE